MLSENRLLDITAYRPLVGHYGVTSVPSGWHCRALSGLFPAAILLVVMLILP